MRYWFAILSGLVLGVGYAVVCLNITHTHSVAMDKNGLCHFNRNAAAMSSMLHKYKVSHGHYPSNNEGLSLLLDPIKSIAEQHYGYVGNLTRCRITTSGILTWWGDPIIYENRRGLSAKAFCFSGVSTDSKHIYSYRVDDGVCLLSIGAKKASERNAARKLKGIIAVICIFLTSAVLLSIYVIANLRGYKESRPHKNALLAVGITLWGLSVALVIALPIMVLWPIFGSFGSCIWQFPRTPELTRAYTATMRSYRDNGIIDIQTYAKRIKALDQDENDKLYHKL